MWKREKNSSEDDMRGPSTLDKRYGVPSTNSSKVEHLTSCRKITKTVLLLCAVLTTGLVVAIPGPTLEFLERNVAVDTEQISYIYPMRAGGVLAGSIVSGVLFDMFPNRDKLWTAISLFFMAIGIGFAPWTSSLLLLCVAMGVGGFWLGFIDTGGNVMMLKIWNKQATPFIHALHFMFGLGAVVAPLIAAPFLPETVKANNIKTQPAIPFAVNDTSIIQDFEITSTPALPTVLGKTYPDLPSSTSIKNLSAVKNREEPLDQTPSTLTSLTPLRVDTQPIRTHPITSSIQNRNENRTTSDPTNLSGLWGYIKTRFHFTSFTQVKEQYPFLIIAGCSVICSLPFMLLECFSGNDSRDSRKTVSGSNEKSHYVSSALKIKIMVCAFMLVMLYVGAERGYGQFIATFGIEYLALSPQDGAFLTSIFWGAFTITRCISIPLSIFPSPAALIVFSLVISVVAAVGLIVGNLVSQTVYLTWIFSGAFGIGCAPICPTALLWIEEHIRLTGKMATVIIIAASTGEMCVPAVIGYLFDLESVGPMGLMYACFACIIGCAVTFFAMQCFVRKAETPKYKYKILQENDWS